ncbi:hypothetical protein SL003B_0412 [Polymorphum gilvum SL003B-26A1]|uniref:Uncharacterized protein n=1 Tax=Polymorphum gilvum (strain LMG 25793 / CGMCC 1.9160 / SL003B-26A1) TaxID=991905 RepID=F2J2X7_POLGS|nr:hypothetical protein SL003B_0412 [Polymorphum gilvum SL003B-26A1]
MRSGARRRSTRRRGKPQATAASRPASPPLCRIACRIACRSFCTDRAGFLPSRDLRGGRWRRRLREWRRRLTSIDVYGGAAFRPTIPATAARRQAADRPHGPGKGEHHEQQAGGPLGGPGSG